MPNKSDSQTTSGAKSGRSSSKSRSANNTPDRDDDGRFKSDNKSRSNK